MQLEKQIYNYVYLFLGDTLLANMVTFVEKRVDPFMTSIQVASPEFTHCKLLLDTLVSSRYTFNEHFGNKQVHCMQIVSNKV